MKRKNTLLLVIALAFAGCSGGVNVARVETEIKHFHELMQAEKVHEIYAQTTEEFRTKASEKELTDLLSAVNTKLGPLKSSEKSGWRVNFDTSGTYVIVGMNAHYERGDATEQFTYRMNGENCQLIGFNINSNALIVN